MIKKQRFAALLILLILVCDGCRDSKNRPVNVIGSTSIQPFAELLAEEYQKNESGCKIDVQGGGSTVGIQALADGIADIGMCSRLLTEEEQKHFTAVEIARDGLAVVVHKSNSIDNLTKQQIQMLFSGSIRNWKELGGQDMPVRLIMREEGSGTREAFVNLVMKKSLVSRKALVQESNGAVKELVRYDPAAVGYMSLGLVGTELKSLAVEGVKPSAEQVGSGRYQLSRPFLFVFKIDAQLRPEAREFIDYVLSHRGQKILESEGLVRVR
jgi:phosphate transport system substrate-binding protein